MLFLTNPPKLFLSSSSPLLPLLLQLFAYSSPPPSTPQTLNEDLAAQILHQKTPSAAILAFRRISSPSSAASAALIRSLVSFHRPDLALSLLPSLPSPPDDSTFVSLLRSLPNPSSTLFALDSFPNPSIRVLNSVLDRLVAHDIDLARRFFRSRIAARSFKGDEFTFGILMKGLCRTNRIDEAFRLLKLMKGSGLKPNPVIYNTLIHALCRNGKVGRARSLFSEMEIDPSSVTFNILISAYCGENNLVNAMVMLEKSFDLGFIPDTITVTKIVELLCSHHRAMEGVEVLERVEEKGGVVDAVSYNTLIKGFCGMEKPQVGQRVLKEMERKGVLPNVRTYNALIAGFCNVSLVDKALELFQEMRMDGISPNFETFDVLIRGLCSCGRVVDGLEVLGMMEEERSGYGNRISPYNSVLYGLYKERKLEEAIEFLKRMASSFHRAVGRSLSILELCTDGKVAEARLVYDQMVREGGVPSALVYVSLIEGLCEEGNTREAFDLLNEMVENGFFPVVATFNALIHAFCKDDQWRSASKLLEEMIRRGCLPNAGSYGSLICSLCRQQYLDRAFSYLVEMLDRHVIPDDETWYSLLKNVTAWNEPESWNRISNAISGCTDD
ncbi:pentatricopeptide repeat-containing protein At2g17525, mitochondrial [Typha latifolia]|uniref:pentatricopeptide repeat-containing protein At2g17525, mitochondrial n=1 Tax=Typha latifolia TaxID=4733 RepID=UPI003C30CC64